MTIPLDRLPRVSVVVPFLDCTERLAACVEALLAQEPVDGAVEIILVDNSASGEGAPLGERYPGLVLVREETRGAYAARNTGVRHARAPLLAFTDADCVVDRDWIGAICDGMRDPAVAMMIGPCRYPANASRALALLAAYENAKAEYVLTRSRPANRFAYANNLAVRAAVHRELGGFREWDRAADTELAHRLAAARPDLQLVFNPAMRITHLEFVRLRDRLRRMSLYTTTNARIPTFDELGVLQRAAILLRMLR
jgi:glycosyltransferase involved in cell wall biosynthesis